MLLRVSSITSYKSVCVYFLVMSAKFLFDCLVCTKPKPSILESCEDGILWAPEWILDRLMA